MTQDGVVKLAKSLGAVELLTGEGAIAHPECLIVRFDVLERLANLVASAEREECAKVCDDLSDRDYGPYGQDAEDRDSDASMQCAQMIRLRSIT